MERTTSTSAHCLPGLACPEKVAVGRVCGAAIRHPGWLGGWVVGSLVECVVAWCDYSIASHTHTACITTVEHAHTRTTHMHARTHSHTHMTTHSQAQNVARMPSRSRSPGDEAKMASVCLVKGYLSSMCTHTRPGSLPLLSSRPLTHLQVQGSRRGSFVREYAETACKISSALSLPLNTLDFDS